MTWLEGFVDDQGRDLRPALAIASGLLGAALGWNAWLLRNGFAPLTSLANTTGGRRFRHYFDDHCDGALAIDWFNIAARLIPRRILP